MPSGIPKKGINKGQFKKGISASPKTQFRKGLTPHNKGKKASAELIEKLRISHLGKISPMKGKKFPFIPHLKARGKTIPLETRLKISFANKGSKSYLWKGGITPENIKARTSLEMRLWRKACYERDNFTCQKYGVRTGGLNVHHINNFSEFPELRTSIENGITLSEKAHKEFHNKYGFRNNTREQLEEFLQKTNE
jgi:hypothetical protein